MTGFAGTGLVALIDLANLPDFAILTTGLAFLILLAEDFFRSALAITLEFPAFTGTACLSSLGPTVLLHAVSASKTDTDRAAQRRRDIWLENRALYILSTL
jgi:hypothetical protein